jgi:acyl carrier protein
MDERTLVDQLRGIVTGVVGDARMPADFDDNTPLAEEGLWLDSVELLQVILACEDMFEITFEPGEDLIGDRLRSLGTLANVIRRRSASPASPGSASRASS